jgi:hypothetical protein
MDHMQDPGLNGGQSLQHPGMEHSVVPHPGMDHTAIAHPGMDHSAIAHPSMDHPAIAYQQSHQDPAMAQMH